MVTGKGLGDYVANVYTRSISIGHCTVAHVNGRLDKSIAASQLYTEQIPISRASSKFRGGLALATVLKLRQSRCRVLGTLYGTAVDISTRCKLDAKVSAIKGTMVSSLVPTSGQDTCAPCASQATMHTPLMIISVPGEALCTIAHRYKTQTVRTAPFQAETAKVETTA